MCIHKGTPNGDAKKDSAYAKSFLVTRTRFELVLPP